MVDLLSALAIFFVGYGTGFLHCHRKAWGRMDQRRLQEMTDQVEGSEFRPSLHSSDDRDERRPR